jgi:hypothetical protein
MEDMIIAMATSVILAAVKNPGKKATLRKALLKIFKSIQAAFPGDPDFQ